MNIGKNEIFTRSNLIEFLGDDVHKYEMILEACKVERN